MNSARLVGRFGWENARFFNENADYKLFGQAIYKKMHTKRQKNALSIHSIGQLFSKRKFKLVSRSPISLVLGSKYRIYPQIHTLPSHESPLILYHLCLCYCVTPFFSRAPIQMILVTHLSHFLWGRVHIFSFSFLSFSFWFWFNEVAL